MKDSIFDLEDRLSNSYKNAQYHDALIIAEQIYQIVKENYDLSHPYFTQSMTNLGKLYHDMGNYRDAE